MQPFNFKSVASAANAAAEKNASTQFIAGGTNLLDLMKKHIAQPDSLLDITGALSDKIEKTATGIRIGAMVRNSAIVNNDEIRRAWPLIAKAVLAGASPQIRNMASTGGNLLQRTRCGYFYDTTVPCNKRKPGSGCSAIGGDNRMHAIVGYSDQCIAVHPSDLCVGLAALDAHVIVTDKTGKRQEIPFRDFHRLPGDRPQQDNNLPAGAVIIAVEINANQFNHNYAYVKLRDRDSYAFALVSVATALQLNGNRIVAARLASGGVAHKPWRWKEAEEFLKGKEANAANFVSAADIVIKGVKPVANNHFKVPMLHGAVITALQESLTVKA